MDGCADGWYGESCSQKYSINNYTNEFLYAGCYNMSSLAVKIDKLYSISVENCIKFCKDAGFTFAALKNKQDIEKCSCGDNRVDLNTSISCNERFGKNKKRDVIKLYKICSVGKYGYNCSLDCHCLNNNSCIYSNGSCEECEPGWIGENCNYKDCSFNNGGCNEREFCISKSSQLENCRCRQGFYRKYWWQQCEDIDECNNDIGLSKKCYDENQWCNNTIGSFNCTCKSGFIPGYNNSCEEIEFKTNIDVSVPVLITLLVVLCILALILCFVFLFKWKLNKQVTNIPKISYKELTTKRTNSNEDNKKNNKPELIYQNISDFEKLKLEDFPKFISTDWSGIGSTFKTIPLGISSSSCDYGKQKQFRNLNRFKNIIPYNDNRVKLQVHNNLEEEDYINASYMKSCSVDNKQIIATQGPNPKTLIHFWNMILEQQIDIIVMLCNIKENGKVKCEQYWPDEKNKVTTFGDVIVKLGQVITWIDYCQRTLLIEKVNNISAPRKVTQLHYTNWPDHGAPENIAYFLDFVKQYRDCSKVNEFYKISAASNAEYSNAVQIDDISTKNKVSVNTVIHCSAGVGRTGSFVAIDYLLEQAKLGNYLDVYKCVSDMRADRIQMVQTQIQYEFIYKALTYYVKFGLTSYKPLEFIKSYEDAKNQNEKMKNQFNYMRSKESSISKAEHKKRKDFSTTSENTMSLINHSTRFGTYICLNEIFDVDVWKKIPEICKTVLVMQDASTNKKDEEELTHLPRIENCIVTHESTIYLESYEEWVLGKMHVIKIVPRQEERLYQNSEEVFQENSKTNFKELILITIPNLKDEEVDIAQVKYLQKKINELNSPSDEIFMVFNNYSREGSYLLCCFDILNDLFEPGKEEISILKCILELKKESLNCINTLTSYKQLHRSFNRFVTQLDEFE